jgi:two-component system NarL family sensor kinase
VLAGARSVAVAVIGGRGRAFGLVGAMSLQPDRFGPEAATFLQAIANMVADAVERRLAEAEIAELSAARGRLVAQSLDAEGRARRRISDALHDGALQDLLAARNELWALGGGDDVHRAQDRLAAVVRHLREIMSAMHPTVLQYGGLEAALAAVADQQATAGRFHADVSVEPDAAGPHDELLLSVARELLSNVARHAHAGRATVSVRSEGDSVVLEVADDGSGLTPGRLEQARAEGRIGLASCRERMEAVGGALHVASVRTGGTTARAAAPAATGRTAWSSDLEQPPNGE